MKRKITMLLLAVAVCLCAAVGLTACSDNNACNHSYSEEWAFDENVHWHACTQENCTAKSNEASHFDDDKDHNCDVCGRKISDHAFENGVCNICNAYDVAGTEGIVYAYNEEAKTYTVAIRVRQRKCVFLGIMPTIRTESRQLMPSPIRRFTISRLHKSTWAT